jgi:hypothetical protein
LEHFKWRLQQDQVAIIREGFLEEVRVQLTHSPKQDSVIKMAELGEKMC